MFKSKKKPTIARDELVAVKSDLVLITPEADDPLLDPKKALKGIKKQQPHMRLSIDLAEDKNEEDGSPLGVRILKVILKISALLFLLYIFVTSLKILASSFRLIGGRTASAVFQQSKLLNNPVAGLMIGVMVTVLVQSSSTSSSIIVSMVAADFLTVPTAIPIIMGANIGTSVTNSFVSLGQVNDRVQFERAFSGATVHDMFNWLCVLIMLPLEVTTGYLFVFSEFLTNALPTNTSADMKFQLLSRITKPLTNKIVQLDKAVLEGWALNDPEFENSTLLKKICPPPEQINMTQIYTCPHLAAQFPLDDVWIGLILLCVALFMLIFCLVGIVRILSSMIQGSVAGVVQRVLNADLPHVPWLTGYIAILIGAVMTFLLQSSSIFTSSLTPLVGLGVITVERMYPLTLGSNLGTTTTALLAAFAADGSRLRPSIQIALVHLLFNITGILIFFPLPIMRFPVTMAKSLGRTTAQYRWFAIVYMIASFCVLPLFVFLVSLGGIIVMYSVMIPLFICILLLIYINIAQDKFPHTLPSILRTWEWLPLPLRSLEPTDKLITKIMCCSATSASDYDHVPGVVHPGSNIATGEIHEDTLEPHIPIDGLQMTVTRPPAETTT